MKLIVVLILLYLHMNCRSAIFIPVFNMHTFKANIEIIGINPFVFLPPAVLLAVCKAAKKEKGPVPVKGFINGAAFIQTLVKYSGHWRLYINGPMLKNSGTKLGDTVTIKIAFDPADRTESFHPKLKAALTANKTAHATFKKMPPSRQKEIKRYINHLKTELSVQQNIAKVMEHLLGNARFAGRDKP